MKVSGSILPVCAAVLALLSLAAHQTAWADRGERPGRGDRHAHPDRHGSGHWRGGVVVRPIIGSRHGPHYGPHDGPHYGPRYGGHRGAWVRPIAPYPHYPRHGLVIHHRPALWTLVTVGALTYIYANGVYYREHVAGGYEVVAPPGDEPLAPSAEAHFVYPRQGQGAERQASDEYECHRWAVQQTGFDPSSVAVGTARSASADQRAGYPRARNACLEGRGYSVE